MQVILGWYPFQVNFADKYLVLPYSRTLNICDVGSGTSRILKYLPSHYSYTGIEPNSLYVSTAKDAYGTRGSFICGGYEVLPNLKAKFDLILAIGVVHHLTDAQCTDFLRYSKSALSDGGSIILIDPVRISSQPLISKLLMDFDRGEHIRYQSEYNSIFDDVSLKYSSDLIINPKELLFPFSFLITKISL